MVGWCCKYSAMSFVSHSFPYKSFVHSSLFPPPLNRRPYISRLTHISNLPFPSSSFLSPTFVRFFYKTSQKYALIADYFTLHSRLYFLPLQAYCYCSALFSHQSYVAPYFPPLSLSFLTTFPHLDAFLLFCPLSLMSCTILPFAHLLFNFAASDLLFLIYPQTPLSCHPPSPHSLLTPPLTFPHFNFFSRHFYVFGSSRHSPPLAAVPFPNHLFLSPSLSLYLSLC